MKGKARWRGVLVAGHYQPLMTLRRLRRLATASALLFVMVTPSPHFYLYCARFRVASIRSGQECSLKRSVASANLFNNGRK